MARPVSYPDSQSFRWITFLYAYVPLLLGAPAWVISECAGGDTLTADEWWLLGGLLVWLPLVFAALPGLASYFFQWRRLSVEQQNRAIAISYYGWGPLAILPIGFLPAAAAPVLSGTTWGDIAIVALYLAAAITLPLVLLGAYGTLYLFARHIAHESKLRRFLRMALLWTLSLGLALALALIPLSAFYVAIMVQSLR